MDANRTIENFITAINQKYPDLVMGYVYVEDEDYYSIWHNNEQIESEDNDFLVFSGNLYKKHFYTDEILNVAFSYDYRMAENVLKQKIKETLNSNNEFVQISINNSMLVSPTKIQPKLFISNPNYEVNSYNGENIATNYKEMAA